MREGDFMKNTRGTTLLETVVAIFILSIAGIMIISGMSVVIRMMSNANTVKDHSDSLLSYAERSSNNTIKNKVSENKTLYNSYKIANDKHTSVNSKIYISELNIKDSKVSLNKVSNAVLPLVSEKFPSLSSSSLMFYNKAQAEANKITDTETYNNSLTSSEFSSLQEFPSELLPSEALRSTAKYMKVFYPWEYRNDAGVMEKHEGTFIYLDSGNQLANIGDSSKIIDIHVIYDYDDKTWYYHPRDGYKLFTMNSYNTIRDGYSSLQYNGTWIMSWKEFMEDYVKVDDSDWLALDMNGTFDSSNPLASWH